MATKKTKKRKLTPEEIELTNRTAQLEVIDSLLDEEDVETADVAAPVAQPVRAGANVTQSGEQVVEEPASATKPKTKEQIVEEIATQNFNKFLAEEKKQVAAEIEKVKAVQGEKYESYIEMLKGTDYYKQCVEKWKKHYANKKAEFVADAEKTVEEMVNGEARQEAMGLTDQQVVAGTPKPTVKKVAPKRDAQVVVAPEKPELKHTISTAGLAVDPALRETIEQIVLTSLYDSFDASKDRFSAEVTELESTRQTGALKEKYLGMVNFRWQLSEALVNSFTKMFDTTNNKTVIKPSGREVSELQTDLDRNQGNMDIGLVADMILDRLYHVDTKSGETSGILPDLIDYLTVRVQEELLKNGQVDFNLYKESAKKIVNKVLVESGFAVDIVKANEASDAKLKYLESFSEAIKALSKDIKSGNVNENTLLTFTTLREQLAELEKNGVKFSEDERKVILEELGNVSFIAKRAPQLARIADPTKRDAEVKQHLASLKASSIRVIDLANQVNAEYKVTKRGAKAYGANVKSIIGPDGKITTIMPRDKGLRPITDHIVMEMLKTAAAENIKGNLPNFNLTDDKTNELTLGLLGVLENERDATADVTISLLEQILLVEHDIRESVKNEPEKYKRVQEAIDRTLKLVETLGNEEEAGEVKNHKKEIEGVLNDFITVSNTKIYGKARPKVDVLAPIK